VAAGTGDGAVLAVAGVLDVVDAADLELVEDAVVGVG
jgi:hypothetical protein